MIDHATPADRLGTSIGAKRAAAIAYLRGRGKYIVDAGCNWTPTNAAGTDVARTIRDYRNETGTAHNRVTPGTPMLLRRQAA
jgi:hypothetical protein